MLCCDRCRKSYGGPETVRVKVESLNTGDLKHYQDIDLCLDCLGVLKNRLNRIVVGMKEESDQIEDTTL